MQLGEYVLRKGHEEAIFGVTYEDTKLIAPDFKDEDDVDDQLAVLVTLKIMKINK